MNKNQREQYVVNLKAASDNVRNAIACLPMDPEVRGEHMMILVQISLATCALVDYQLKRTLDREIEQEF